MCVFKYTPKEFDNTKSSQVKKRISIQIPTHSYVPIDMHSVAETINPFTHGQNNNNNVKQISE